MELRFLDSWSSPLSTTFYCFKLCSVKYGLWNQKDTISKSDSKFSHLSSLSGRFFTLKMRIKWGHQHLAQKARNGDGRVPSKFADLRRRPRNGRGDRWGYYYYFSFIILIHFLMYSASPLIRIAKVCHDAWIKLFSSIFYLNRWRSPTVFIGSLFSADSWHLTILF